MKDKLNSIKKTFSSHTNEKIRSKNRSLWLNILIISVILIVINLISINMFTRFDFSQGKIYSLSRASKNTVRELPDRLLIKAYFSQNLPPQLAESNRYIRDILSEYQAYSRGRIRFEFIDPKDEDQLRQEAQKHGVTPMSMRVVEQDKLEIREIFMGLVFLYRGKTETIPFIQDTRGLEYDLTGAIKKITDIGRRKVAIYKQHDEAPPQMMGRQQVQSNYESVSKMISDNYSLIDTELFEKIDDDIDVLIVAGVVDDLDYEQQYNLDQFIMRGGNLLVFQNGINANLQTQQASAVEANILEMLQHYGINVKQNIVTDANAGQIQVQRQQGIFSYATPVNYPPFPVINNMNREHILTKNLEQIQMIFTSELEPYQGQNQLTFTPLLQTSNNSGEIRQPNLDISFERYMQQRDLRRILNAPPKTVAALFEGVVNSFFLDGLPADIDLDEQDFYSNNNEAKFIVVGDADFIQETGGAGVKSNLDFVLNSIDYLMDDTLLIEIRARETVFRPLKDLTNAQMRFIRWLNILLPSFLLLLFGLINYHKQIQKRKVIRSIYEQE